jgi:ligand-binding sensor domain-containing protein
MKFKKIGHFITCFFLVSVTIAQQSKTGETAVQYRSVNWGINEGLSQATVGAILKDINGFLWIGTSYGLNRFDGGGFKKYYADKARKNKTIIGNVVNSLIEDSQHNIWIGTDRGISCHDTRADTFRNISSQHLGEDIIPFWATSDEVFCWIGQRMLIAYNIRTLQSRILARITIEDTVGFGASNQYAIFDASSNSVWLQRGFRGTAGGLLQLSLADGKRNKFDWPCFLNIPNHSHRSEGMHYDHKRNSIWICSPDGLVEFTLADKRFHNIEAQDKFAKRKDFWQWAGIDIDTAGRVWMSTVPAGMMIYDPDNRSLSLLFPNDSVQQQNVSDQNIFLYCDKEGMTWSGYFTDKGLYQVIPYSPAVKLYTADARQAHGLASNEVAGCIRANDGMIWMGSPGGITVFDPHTGFFDFIVIKNLPGISQDKNSFILVLNVDTVNKRGWIYCDGSYFEMDINTRKCKRVLYEDSNGKKSTFDSVLAHHPANRYPFAYKNTLMFLASLPNHQEILWVNGDDAVARKIVSFPGGPINTEDLTSICTNDEDLLFVKRRSAATNLTYVRRNNNWTLMPTPLDSVEWSRICYNKQDQTYWVIEETQLTHFDKNFRVIRHYSGEDGMPGLQIHGVIVDNNRNAWFNTDHSIFQLNTKTGTITALAEKDGLPPGNYGYLRGDKDDAGDIYFESGIGGFYRLSPRKYVFSASTVYFESFKISQQIFPLSASINQMNELSLKYFENNIDIETGIIDYYSKGKGHIRYKLVAEGKNSGWQYAPANYTIRYEGLPPGQYKLILQSSNASNEFNGPEKVLSIIIHPAFWQTWWFRILAAVFALSIFYLVIRYRTRQRFRLQLERTGKEKQIAELGQRSAELQRQKIEVEMQALRAQMNPHFIFNSLNSINRFILQNERLQASEYLIKFSKLVRMILENSQQPLISLESELKALDLYLEMESLRFNHRFDYKISIPRDLDVEVLKVPPLIIQPYVENAIWHGLMHKEERGQLGVSAWEDNGHVYLKVTDNGIGRKKASELASKSATKHKSVGLRITKERIAMLEKSNGTESPVQFKDLENTDGSAAGTEVTIKLPVIEGD